jgi:hypothetical protein
MEYILIGAIAIIVFIILFLFIKVDTLRNKANALFLQAEKHVTEDKLQYVSDNLYENAPSIFRLIFNEEEFRDLVQMIYDSTRKTAKDLLDDGKINKSSEEE